MADHMRRDGAARPSEAPRRQRPQAGGSARHARHARQPQGRQGSRSAARRQPDGRQKARPQGTGVVSQGTSTMRMSQRTAQATCHARGQAGRSGSHGHPGAPRRRHILPVLLGICVVCALGFAFWRLVWPRIHPSAGPATQVEAGQQVSVTIPEGAGGSQIAQILSDAGVISDVKEFQKAVQTLGADSQMKSGTYSFLTGSNPEEVVRRLMSGPDSSGNLTIPEGQTTDKVAETVEASLGIPKQDFLEQAKASNYVADYPFLAAAQDDSLEGFLYPMTYDLPDGADADAVIRAMLDQYQVHVASLDFADAEQQIQASYGVQVDDYGILTIASIIEKEALTDDDRYNISSVIYNRLKQGMALQSDATMGYVTGGEVSASDLQTDSPYNTYLHQGLTPTPICNPGLASIKAALAPASTSYLYFWITQDEHVFSETYEQHLQAINSSSSSAAASSDADQAASGQ